MMKLIQNIDVYAPQHLGKKDVLTINDKIEMCIRDSIYSEHVKKFL